MKVKAFLREVLVTIVASAIYGGYVFLCGIGEFAEKTIDLIWKLGGEKSR